jgi:hypothetical protein
VLDVKNYGYYLKLGGSSHVHDIFCYKTAFCKPNILVSCTKTSLIEVYANVSLQILFTGCVEVLAQSFQVFAGTFETLDDGIAKSWKIILCRLTWFYLPNNPAYIQTLEVLSMLNVAKEYLPKYIISRPAVKSSQPSKPRLLTALEIHPIEK